MKSKKTAAVIITVLFVFFVLFSHIFIIAEADHDCCGENCPVCEIIAVIEDSIKGLSLLSSALIACGALIFVFIKALYSTVKNDFLSTLITLKVKLSN